MIPHYCPNCGKKIEFSPQKPICPQCKADLAGLTGIKTLKEKEVDKFTDFVFKLIKNYVIFELAGIMFFILIFIILFTILIIWLI